MSSLAVCADISRPNENFGSRSQSRDYSLMEILKIRPLSRFDLLCSVRRRVHIFAANTNRIESTIADTGAEK
jgi:hypothetical protein